jgi:ribosome recycling factor
MKAMGKMIKQEGESTRTAIRSARRAALEQVKKLASKDAQRQEEKKVHIGACDTDVTLLSGLLKTCSYVTIFTGMAIET